MVGGSGDAFGVHCPVKFQFVVGCGKGVGVGHCQFYVAVGESLTVGGKEFEFH